MGDRRPDSEGRFLAFEPAPAANTVRAQRTQKVSMTVLGFVKNDVEERSSSVISVELIVVGSWGYLASF